MPWVSGSQLGGQGVLGQGDEGVPAAGAGLPRIPPRRAGLSRRAGFAGLLVHLVDPVLGSGFGSGEGEERGLEEGTVLGRPAAADPDPTGPVLADGQVAVEVGGAFLPLQPGLQPPVDRVGVDDLDQVPTGPGQLGGVEVGRLADHQPLAAAAGPVPRRQLGHRGDDQVGLARGHRPGHQRLPGPGQRTGQRLRSGHPSFPLALAQPS